MVFFTSHFTLALSYSKTIFSSTKTLSHLRFLRTCLKYKVIPTGMSLSHTPSDAFSNILRLKTSAILHRSSLQIMRTHIQALSNKHVILQRNLKNLDSALRRLYHPSLILLLKVFTLSLNAILQQSLSETKQKKLSSLLCTRTKLSVSGTPPPDHNTCPFHGPQNRHPPCSNWLTHAACLSPGLQNLHCYGDQHWPHSLNTSTQNDTSSDGNNHCPPSARPTLKEVTCIPPDLQLSQDERSVLSKGLKFIPTTPTCNKSDLMCDIKNFFRSIRWQAALGHPPKKQPSANEDTFTKLFKTPLHREPPHGLFHQVETFITTCTNKIRSLKNPKLRKLNLTPTEIQALRSLQARSDIVIKPADKGGSVVVWDRDLYIQEATNQLTNHTHYKKSDAGTFVSNQNTIKKNN